MTKNRKFEVGDIVICARSPYQLLERDTKNDDIDDYGKPDAAWIAEGRMSCKYFPLYESELTPTGYTSFADFWKDRANVVDLSIN